MTSKELCVLGLDPGLTASSPTGVALVRGDVLMDSRCVELDGAGDWGERLDHVIDFLEKYFEAHQAVIEAAAYEIPFTGPSRKVGIMLAHVGGVLRAVAWRYGVMVAQVYPSQAKLALAGSGQAGKERMIEAARERFGREVTKDEADAIGVSVAAKEMFK